MTDLEKCWQAFTEAFVVRKEVKCKYCDQQAVGRPAEMCEDHRAITWIMARLRGQGDKATVALVATHLLFHNIRLGRKLEDLCASMPEFGDKEGDGDPA